MHPLYRVPLVSLLVMLVCAFGVGGLVSLIDTYCFPDLVYENLGYYLITLFRLLPLISLSIITRTIAGALSGGNKRRAGLMCLVGGSLVAIPLLLIGYGDFTSDWPRNSLLWSLRESFFEWGEYFIWAIGLLIFGFLLRRSRKPSDEDNAAHALG